METSRNPSPSSSSSSTPSSEEVFRGQITAKSRQADSLADCLLRQDRQAREAGRPVGGRVVLDLTVLPHPGVPWLGGRTLLLANSRPGAPGWSSLTLEFVCNLPIASEDVVPERDRLRLHDEFFLESCSQEEPGKWRCHLMSGTQDEVNVQTAPSVDLPGD